MDIDDIIRKDARNINPGRGSLLIANPLMSDSYFGRSVILMLSENSGDIGVVINKPTSLTLDLILPGIGENVNVYCGGPVDHERMFILHRLPDVFKNSLHICGDLYVGGTIQELIDYLSEGNPVEDKLKVILGYSGWDESQLTGELLKNYWAVNNIADYRNLLEEADESLWREEVERLGDEYRSWLVVPEDPSMN